MKRTMKFIALLFTFLIVITGYVHATNDSKNIYVVPIREEITNATVGYLEKAIKAAESGGYDALVIELDTYGGLVDAAESIKNLIMGTSLDTICFIDSKAESAGVLIAISCEKIAMNPHGSIGSAETIPNTEKILSMWRSMLRGVAQTRGRDPQIVEAMADVTVIIPGLSEDGKLLNLTANEALEHGITDSIAKTSDEALSSLGYVDYSTEYAEEDWATKLAKFASTQWASSLLLVIGVLAMVIEIFAPGFGIPGIISLLSFGLFFGANLFVGNASWISIFMFVLGVLLIVVEMFIPGFGLPGVSGLILLFLGIGTSMQSLEHAITAIFISMLTGILAVIILFKYGFKSSLFDRITLFTSSPNKMVVKDNRIDQSTIEIGQIATAMTVLRPSGFIELNGEKLDAIAESEWIRKGASVEIIQIEGRKIIVKEI